MPSPYPQERRGRPSPRGRHAFNVARVAPYGRDTRQERPSASGPSPSPRGHPNTGDTGVRRVVVPSPVTDGSHGTVGTAHTQPVFGAGPVLSPISEISDVDLVGPGTSRTESSCDELDAVRDADATADEVVTELLNAVLDHAICRSDATLVPYETQG